MGGMRWAGMAAGKGARLVGEWGRGVCRVQILVAGKDGCLVAACAWVGGAGKCCGCVRELLAAGAKTALGNGREGCVGWRVNRDETSLNDAVLDISICALAGDWRGSFRNIFIAFEVFAYLRCDNIDIVIEIWNRREWWVAPLAGFEPATRCLEGSRSIRLSYRGASVSMN